MGILIRFFLIILAVFVVFPVSYGADEGSRYFDLGLFAYEDGDFVKAEGHFLRALEMNSRNPRYHYYLGKTYLKTEQYKKARKSMNTAWNLDPEIPGLKYDVALLGYKTFNYVRAANLFAEIVKADPSNTLAQYHAGMSLYKLNQYEEAVGYLEEALDGDLSLRERAYYYTGICFQKMGKINKALAMFEYVRDHADSEKLVEYAKKKIERLSKKPLDLYLKVGFKYDDNIRLDPLDQDIYSDEEDFLTEVFFFGRYNMVDNSTFRLGTGYSHFQTLHLDLEEYDLIASAFNLYAKYLYESYTFGFSYLPYYYWVEYDRYLFRHELRPEVSWRISNVFSMRLSYSLFVNDYLQDDDRDGRTHETSLDVHYGLADKLGYLFVGGMYEKNSADHSNYEYGQTGAKFGASLNLPLDIRMKLTVKLYDRDYDSEDSIYNIKREDEKYIGTMAVSRRILYKWLTLSGRYDYTENDSNIDDYAYRKNAVSMILTAIY
ncbi:MAG: tetratricopeptide repeat protein [Thermodesulfobacteriota bacterium]|nr:tetratricopeptide repeat protein [Thermodesulfobacteriota bacterium]